MATKPENKRPKKVHGDKLVTFMARHGLKPHPWAQKAGLRSSTLYNYLAGKSKSLSSDSLQKLARAAGVTVDELLGGTPPPDAIEPAQTVPVLWIVGAFGRLHPMEPPETAPHPPGVDPTLMLEAARVDVDALRPIPGGWIVFYEKQPRPPLELIGKLAVVRTRAFSEPVVREIRRGSMAGLYTLMSLNSAPSEDAEVIAAHRVVAFTQAG